MLLVKHLVSDKLLVVEFWKKNLICEFTAGGGLMGTPNSCDVCSRVNCAFIASDFAQGILTCLY